MTKYQNDTDETASNTEPIGRQRAIRVDVPTNLENIRVILFERASRVTSDLLRVR